VSSELGGVIVTAVRLYAVVDSALSPKFSLGDSLEVFVRRDDAERFIVEVRATSRRPWRSCRSRSGSWRRAGRTS